MSDNKVTVFTKEWCEAVKDWYNNDKQAREDAKGMTLKVFYVATGCPGGVDKIVVWEFTDGLMTELKIAAEAPSPVKEWKSFKLLFPTADWWGGWLGPYHNGLDLMDPVEEAGKPVRARADMVKLLSDGRVTAVLSPMKVYPLAKQLKAWLDSMAGAQIHFGFERPGYVPNGKDPCS